MTKIRFPLYSEIYINARKVLQQHILLSSWYISVFQKTVILKEDSPRTSAA